MQGKRTIGTGPKNERFNTQTDLLPPKAGKASQLLKMLPTKGNKNGQHYGDTELCPPNGQPAA